jgi:hypothetical protein
MNVPPQFEPMRERPGWYRSPPRDAEALMTTAIALQELFPPPVQLVVGGLDEEHAHRIYLAENASAADIARAFRTGTHDGYELTEQVCDELMRVFAVAPFRPFYADPAGYKATFTHPLSRDEALAIEEIMTVGLDYYISEAGIDTFVADLLMRDENFLFLWWD